MNLALTKQKRRPPALFMEESSAQRESLDLPYYRRTRP
jgi:hypothetical protein